VKRFTRVLLGVALLICGTLLALYGVFGMLPAEPSGGDSYVTLGGRQMDAKLVGGISLAIALLTFLAARLLLKRRKIARPS
jgi:hypothetical protein